MENSLKESVIKKIQKAKLFLELGKDCFRVIENVERVGAGIILLQDSVELFLIAICEQLEVNYNPSQITFNQYFDKIEDKLRKEIPKETIPLKNEMIKLNKQRIAIKHYGILPNIGDCKNLDNSVNLFFEELSKRYLKIDFISISLVNLLNDDNIKNLMKQAEVNLKSRSYKECQINCRKAIYLVFEKQFDIRPFEEYEEDIKSKSVLSEALRRPLSLAPEYAKNKQYIKENVKEPTDYIVINTNEIERDLLSNGIDSIDFYNVMRLTPEVYLFEEEDWAVKEEVSGIKFNEENAEYCFRKAIEILLIKQRNLEREKYISLEISTITIKNKEINVLEKASLKGKVAYKIEKKSQYEILIGDEVRGLDTKNKYYHIMGRKEKDKYKNKFKYFSGYILKNDVERI